MTIRASGQVASEVTSYTEILELTLKAWKGMSFQTLAAAWVACGYIGESSINLQTPAGRQNLVEKAQTLLSDLFSPYGKDWSPQRCTCYEWQIKDWPPWHFKILHHCAMLVSNLRGDTCKNKGPSHANALRISCQTSSL